MLPRRPDRLDDFEDRKRLNFTPVDLRELGITVSHGCPRHGTEQPAAWALSLGTRPVESEPNNLYADTIAPVRRSKPDEVFFVRMEAAPAPGSDDFGTEGGAYVNCYVDADDLRTAELRSISLIQEHGWLPQRFDDWELTCLERAEDKEPEHGGPSPRALVHQAQLDGEACVFHCWPIDAPDADEPNE